eukprot:161086-Hanusia_phi.AAC.1
MTMQPRLRVEMFPGMNSDEGQERQAEEEPRAGMQGRRVEEEEKEEVGGREEQEEKVGSEEGGGGGIPLPYFSFFPVLIASHNLVNGT